MKFFKTISSILIFIFLTSCGQSGPLYLPKGYGQQTTVQQQQK